MSVNIFNTLPPGIKNINSNHLFNKQLLKYVHANSCYTIPEIDSLLRSQLLRYIYHTFIAVVIAVAAEEKKLTVKS